MVVNGGDDSMGSQLESLQRNSFFFLSALILQLVIWSLGGKQLYLS